MSNLFSIIQSAGGALQTYQQASSVVENNVTNSSTPGYVRQDPTFTALPFLSDGSLGGGVTAGVTQDSRDAYAEQAVRNEASNQGYYSQLSSGLSNLDSMFDISGNSGVSGAMNDLFSKFSSWATNPDDSSTRQAVLTSAGGLASAFQLASKQVSSLTTTVEQTLSSTVGKINQLATKIQAYNQAKLAGSANDPSQDADLYNNLETLSGLVNITTLKQSDGTVTVLAGGQTPLVIGTNVKTLSVAHPADPSAVNAAGTPHAAIVTSDGSNITSQVTQGELGGLLHVRNVDIPGLAGDTQQAGNLNTLAQTLADRVNSYLTNAGGTALFTYSGTDATAVASTLAVNPALTAAQLVASDSNTSNGTAQTLADLGTSTNAADQINGLGIIKFFAGVISDVGQKIADAKSQKTQADTLVTQAQGLRSQVSGVSLDQEAIRITELQRSYQASARMVTVVDDMLSTLLNMFP